MLKLIDSNNFVRISLETNVSGLALREIVESTRSGPLQCFCWDGFQANARRRAIHPEYKMRRTPPAGNIFASFDLLKRALEHTRSMQIEVPGYEADDVIAKFVRSTPDPVEIHSTDLDFAQLMAEFPKRVFAGCRLKVPAELVKLYKMTVGDPSDNIPGIKGFGQTYWDRTDKAALQQVVDGADPEPLEVRVGVKNWIRDNRDLLAKFKQIIEFIDIDDELFTANIKSGIPNYDKASTILKEFML